MGKKLKKVEALLQELIETAKKRNIDVRTEKLLREVGYRARSGHCRLKEKDLIILDRDAPLGDQVDFLAGELSQRESKTTQPPPPSEKTP